MAWLASLDDSAGGEWLCARPARDGQDPLLCHQRYPGDAAVVKDLLERLEGLVDPAEPFARIREAMTEARKIGVTRT
jgi:hypothetical protein